MGYIIGRSFKSLNWYLRDRVKSYLGRIIDWERRDIERSKVVVCIRVLTIESVSEKEREEWLLSSCYEDFRDDGKRGFLGFLLFFWIILVKF